MDRTKDTRIFYPVSGELFPRSSSNAWPNISSGSTKPSTR